MSKRTLRDSNNGQCSLRYSYTRNLLLHSFIIFLINPNKNSLSPSSPSSPTFPSSTVGNAAAAVAAAAAELLNSGLNLAALSLVLPSVP